jgi:fructoselysine-6-P-deglycase FrlB-like protein
MADPMGDEIREQPERLEALRGGMPDRIREALDRVGLAHAAPRSFRFVGCGDMHFAAESAAWTAHSALGLPARAWRSMDVRWMRPPGDPSGGLAVAASVSGRTPRTIEAARRLRAAGVRTIGLTANPGSPLTESVDAVLGVDLGPSEGFARHEYAGYRHQIAQTLSYSAVLYAELLLLRESAARLGGRSEALAGLEEVPAALGACLARIEEGAREAAAGGEFRSRVAVLGSGPWLPVARYAAAKHLEFAVPALAQCLEEYNHLEAFVAGPDTLVVYLALDAASADRVREMVEPMGQLGVESLIVHGEELSFDGTGARSLALPPGRGEVRLFQAVAALQCLALQGARRAGRDTTRWLGGVRTETLNRISLRTIRGSRIDGGGPET